MSTVNPGSASAGAARVVKPMIEVSLDQPLLGENLFPEATKKVAAKGGPSFVTRWSQKVAAALGGARGLSDLFSNNVVRVAAIALMVAFAATMMVRVSGGLAQGLSKFFKTLNGRMERVMERVSPAEEGIPMPFEEASEGWGVSTERAKKRLGKTNFIQYEFELPEPD